MRVNVDETLFRDFRFRHLARELGSEDMAIGLLVRFWFVAAEHWADEKLMTAERFHLEGFEPIAASGLAELLPGGYYAKGAARFEWLHKRQSSAQKAGRASAAKRKQLYGTAQPSQNTKLPNVAERLPERPFETFVEPPNAPAPVPAQTLSPTKNKGIDNSLPPASGSLDDPPLPARKKRAPKVDGVQDFIKGFAEAYQGAYGCSPVITGAEAGAAKAIVKAVGLERAKELAEVYLRMGDRWFVEKAHSLKVMLGDLTKIASHRPKMAAPEPAPVILGWDAPFTDEVKEQAFQAWWGSLSAQERQAEMVHGVFERQVFVRRIWKIAAV